MTTKVTSRSTTPRRPRRSDDRLKVLRWWDFHVLAPFCLSNALPPNSFPRAALCARPRQRTTSQGRHRPEARRSAATQRRRRRFPAAVAVASRPASRRGPRPAARGAARRLRTPAASWPDIDRTPDFTFFACSIIANHLSFFSFFERGEALLTQQCRVRCSSYCLAEYLVCWIRHHSGYLMFR